MPWFADYGPDSAEITFHGHTTGAEILEAKAQFFAHPFERGPRYAVCDFSGVETFDVSSADVRRIVQQDREAAARHPDVMEAVVAPRQVEYGMSRMWELLVEDVRPRTAVRQTRAEVVAWLVEQKVPLTPEQRRALATSRAR